MAARVPWVSGRSDEARVYAGTDFIIARDGRIAAVYLFFGQTVIHRHSAAVMCLSRSRAGAAEHRELFVPAIAVPLQPMLEHRFDSLAVFQVTPGPPKGIDAVKELVDSDIHLDLFQAIQPS